MQDAWWNGYHHLEWLRSMTEHECHHRGEILSLFLSMLDVPTPPLYGLTSEQVRE